MNIAIDCGKGATKFKSKLFKGEFATRYDNIRNKDYDLQENNYIVENEEGRFLIGNLAKNKDNNNEKSTQLHRLSIYTAICNCIKPSSKSVDVKINIGCPVSLYLDKEYKKEYANYIKRAGENIKINVNNNEYNFRIKNIMISCEGTGFVYTEQDINDEDILNIDIGDLNVNSIGFRGGVPLPNSMITLNKGYSYLKELLNDNINKFNKGKRLSSFKLDKTLDSEYLKIKGEEIQETNETIKSVKKEYIQEILTDLRSSIDLNEYDRIRFTGGGVYTLKNYLSDDNYETGNHLENVNGFYERISNKYEDGDENN